MVDVKEKHDVKEHKAKDEAKELSAPQTWNAAVRAARPLPKQWVPKNAELQIKGLRDQSRLSALRWEPSAPVELFSAIFTWWTLLDKIMLSRIPGNYATGYVRELQVCSSTAACAT